MVTFAKSNLVREIAKIAICSVQGDLERLSVQLVEDLARTVPPALFVIVAGVLVLLVGPRGAGSGFLVRAQFPLVANSTLGIGENSKINLCWVKNHLVYGACHVLGND